MAESRSMSAHYAKGPGDQCRCGTTLPPGESTWGCTGCSGDCCPACASWLESTVYCRHCTADLLAA
jgi:hypothetical protein